MNFPLHNVDWTQGLNAIFDLITFISCMLILVTTSKVVKSGHIKKLKSLYPILWQLGALYILFCGLSNLGSFIEILYNIVPYWITIVNLALGFTSALFAIVFWRLKYDLIYFATILREIKEEDENARN